MIGEHALFWLGMDTNVLTDHRDKLGVVYLLSVTALLIVTFERDEPDSHRLLKKRRRRASDVFSGRHHMNRNAGGRHGRSKGRRGRMELDDPPGERLGRGLNARDVGDAVTILGYAPVYKVIRVASPTPPGLAAGGFFA
jgi:hypothetical protein